MQITLSDELQPTLISLKKSNPMIPIERIIEDAIYEYDLREKIKVGLEDIKAGRVREFNLEEFKLELEKRIQENRNLTS